MQICFASHNLNKIAEMTYMMPKNVSMIGLRDLGIVEDIAETGNTFEENASIKARYVYEKHGIPTFADDSGLCVATLHGEPGVYSARYAAIHKSDKDNIDLLLDNLKGIAERAAKFRTVITFIDEKGAAKQFSGEVNGIITTEKRGKNGFGYDPIFQPFGYEKTFAELPHEEKNKISHRAKAVQFFLEYLQKTYV